MKIQRISNFQWLLILAMGALVVFFVSALSLYLGINKREHVSEDITELVPFWLFWVIHAPLVFILSRRVSFDRTRLIKSLPVYLLVGTVWAMLVQGLPLILLLILTNLTSYNFEQLYRTNYHWASILILNMAVYWVILSSSLIFVYYERYQKEMLKASKLDAHR